MDWLTVCAEGQTENCVAPIQVAYLAVVVVGVVLLFFVARRSRDLSTATLTLIPVAIAINIAVGSIAVALRLPIYLDSIGTVLVGVLAGPWAGALTGLLSNLIWSLLPVPGGAGPVAAFFAPVAGVIGLMAGFWGTRGVFRLRAEDARVGSFLALATGIASSIVALLLVQATIGISFSFDDVDSQNRFVVLGIVIVAFGVVVGWISGRTVYQLEGKPDRARSYLIGAATLSATALAFAMVRLLFGPTGYFSAIGGRNDDGTPDTFLGGANLTGFAIADPGGLIGAAIVGLVIGFVVYSWARRGENARLLFPVCGSEG